MGVHDLACTLESPEVPAQPSQIRLSQGAAQAVVSDASSVLPRLRTIGGNMTASENAAQCPHFQSDKTEEVTEHVPLRPQLGEGGSRSGTHTFEAFCPECGLMSDFYPRGSSCKTSEQPCFSKPLGCPKKSPSWSFL